MYVTFDLMPGPEPDFAHDDRMGQNSLDLKAKIVIENRHAVSLHGSKVLPGLVSRAGILRSWTAVSAMTGSAYLVQNPSA